MKKTKTSDPDLKNIVPILSNVIAMAMGIVAIVLSIVGEAVNPILFAVALIALGFSGLNSIDKKKDEAE